MAGTITSGLQVSTKQGKHDVLFSWVQTRNRRKAYSMTCLAWPVLDIHCEENLTHSNSFRGGGRRCEQSRDPCVPTSSPTSGADTHQTPADLHIPGALGAGNACPDGRSTPAPRCRPWPSRAQPRGSAMRAAALNACHRDPGVGKWDGVILGTFIFLHERNQRPERAKERSIYGGRDVLYTHIAAWVL